MTTPPTQLFTRLRRPSEGVVTLDRFHAPVKLWPGPTPKQLDSLNAHIQELEREVVRLKGQVQLADDHQRGDCWYWQGDGDDHLESLVGSLPVVIRADDLRALIDGNAGRST